MTWDDLFALLFAGLVAGAIAFAFLDCFCFWMTGESIHHALVHKGAHDKIGCPSSTSENGVSCFW